MTQENEMPNEIYVVDGQTWWEYADPRIYKTTPYIRRAVSKEEAGRLSRVVDFTLEYYEEEFPQEAFPGVWNEPLSPYAGGLTPNDLVELRKLLGAHK